MRKWILCIAMCASLSGCTQYVVYEEEEVEEPAVVEVTATPEVTLQPVHTGEPVTADIPSSEGVDMDLTLMSGTVIYSEVYRMLTEPQEFDGKVIKITGLFSIGQNEQRQRIFGCVIPDATACCAQGIEFRLAGDYTYPDDYPALGSRITIQGKFAYDTLDNYYNVHLDDAILVDG